MTKNTQDSKGHDSKDINTSTTLHGEEVDDAAAAAGLIEHKDDAQSVSPKALKKRIASIAIAVLAVVLLSVGVFAINTHSSHSSDQISIAQKSDNVNADANEGVNKEDSSDDAKPHEDAQTNKTVEKDKSAQAGKSDADERTTDAQKVEESSPSPETSAEKSSAHSGDGSSSSSNSNSSKSTARSTAQSKSQNSTSNGTSTNSAQSTSSTPSQPVQNPDPGPFVVSISVEGMGTQQVTLWEGATVYDALVASGAAISTKQSSYGLYITSINGEAASRRSGWCYSVNGVWGDRSAAAKYLSRGDYVSWVHCSAP